ncbi:unnamed protein product [Brachionus calyciflorus]|uniref:Uncharacterized protein n=1 Tax=Brachionus calyciflorus TaxID=104777 RepID=A0A813PWJ3_9BILA|nr:unnamed protein product [Brachionus calyciflorus]
MRSVVVLALVASLVVLAQSESILPRAWLTSCKPCVETLQECSVCIKGGCDICFADIQDTGCSKCASDIKKANLGVFYCDPSFEYHQLACLVSCRWRSDAFYTTGSCSNVTAQCICA